MTTDRTYLVAGSLGHRLNEALPESTTVLETEIDIEREGVHVRVQVGKVSLYAFVDDKSITSHIDRSMALGDDRFNSPNKVFTMQGYMTDGTWSQFVCDYITAEVNYLLAVINRGMDFGYVQPTGSDYVKSQAETEQGWSLA
jgi:hypothetical protein